MRTRSICSRLTAALSASIALLLPLSVQNAYADTYQLTTVEYTQSENFYGIDALGDYTVNRTSSLAGPGRTCGTVPDAPSCYATYYAGSNTPVFTTAAPTLTWDNGSSCTPALPGFNIVSGLCNGSHFLAAGTYPLPNNTDLRGIWDGPNPDPYANLLSNGSIDGGFINSSGDAVFVDGLDNSLVFADDLSSDIAPEPSSLILLGTGSLALFGAVRRRVAR